MASLSFGETFELESCPRSWGAINHHSGNLSVQRSKILADRKYPCSTTTVPATPQSECLTVRVWLSLWLFRHWSWELYWILRTTVTLGVTPLFPQTLRIGFGSCTLRRECEPYSYFMFEACVDFEQRLGDDDLSRVHNLLNVLRAWIESLSQLEMLLRFSRAEIDS